MDRDLLRDGEANETVQRGVELQHQSFEDVRLNVGARKPVEEEPVGVGVVDDGLLDDLDDDLIRDKPTGGDDRLGLEAQTCFVRDLLSEKVASRDLIEVVVLDEKL